MDARRDALTGLRILIVEDELLVAMLVEGMLKELQCEVIGPVSSVDDAIAAARTCDLDGALLDVNLRGKSSSAAADAFLECALPFLLVTGYTASDAEPPAFQTASRINKPFCIEDLTDHMLDAFAGRPKAH